MIPFLSALLLSPNTISATPTITRPHTTPNIPSHMYFLILRRRNITDNKAVNIITAPVSQEETFITFNQYQGGHGTGKTGKTGNLTLTFSRQGKHREFCCDTGKIVETQGKYRVATAQGKQGKQGI